MKNKLLRPLACGLFILSTTTLLRADHEADRRNEVIPVGHTMHPPLHRFNPPLNRFIAPLASAGPTGYTPQQLRHAYGFDQLGTTGSGQIIAIVDAYGSPTMQADLNTFCTAFGIPSTTVAIYYPQGQPAVNSGWGSETSLDVEWAHAIAPGATIALIAAKSDSTADLFAAVDYAVSLGAKQVSMSWGGSEFSTEASSDFHFNVPGVAFFASAGDDGAGAESPASSPFVVGVGGTTLHLDSSSNISSETVWSGSGGGLSAYEPIPSYQAGWLSGSKRGIPDVAYDADPNTGVPIYQTGAGWAQFGGTSMSAPQWAALFALANSLRAQSIGSAPGALYSLANANYSGYFRDITSGSNGHAAGPRYDLATGLGTPLGNQLVLALAGGSPSQAATPVFSPAPGTYSSAQNVTLTSATSGASLRYTVDGSTPTETHGTVYSVPVSISATTTLKAIAYKSGLGDSTVTSGIYTIATGSAPINLEAENLAPVGTGATVSISNDANASGGVVEFLNSTAAGQSITFTTPGIPAGTYQVQLRYKTNTSRGQHTVAIDGTPVGGPIDQYAKTSAYVTATLGNVTFSTSGAHTIVMNVTGKNTSATQFYLTADVFTLTPQSSSPPPAGAPNFSPVGGTYSTAQSVTITSSTSGASIRYTTDGSTPSETAGTLYSGPVSISATSTLQALAFASGFTDSTVSSATYTISTGGGGGGTTVSFEAESLTYTPSGATASVQTDTNSSGGKWVELAGNSVGDSISYAVPSVTAGTYQVQMKWKGNTSRGILQLSVDGTNVGPTLDQYSAAQSYPTTTFGPVTFSATGTHTIKLTVTGKNGSSSNYQLSSDKFTFVAQ
ncbi:MAG TPA: chitobiase/beta-hexosaminidase C-terminal domain-containing protein [Opitutaceae bacterium]|jgi:hypothetical protein|nr:chitobiase/beta-hexosaminidase C-terminal domain-containing protein [Opitutaceae bacterium]